MTATIPKTREEILATGKPDQDFVTSFASSPMASFKPSNIHELKDVMEASRALAEAALASTKPADIRETELFIPLHDDYKSRIIVIHKKNLAPNAPLIVLFHGGAHCVGFPEMEVPLARELALKENAVVVCPAYRLAPERPFPASIEDAWSTVQHLAAESRRPHDPSHPILPAETSPETGFIVGGISAGANLSSSIAHVARDTKLTPPITGQFLAAGMFISAARVPDKYRPYYLSREQNAESPLYSNDMYEMFQAAFKPDHNDKRYTSFDQHDPQDKPGEVAHGHIGLPPAYFQVCGYDISRDDSLIYENVLREESKVPTRLDLYAGMPHCWWGVLPHLESSVKRMKDSVEGVKWLLSFSNAS